MLKLNYPCRRIRDYYDKLQMASRFIKTPIRGVKVYIHKKWVQLSRHHETRSRSSIRSYFPSQQSASHKTNESLKTITVSNLSQDAFRTATSIQIQTAHEQTCVQSCTLVNSDRLASVHQIFNRCRFNKPPTTERETRDLFFWSVNPTVFTSLPTN